MKLFAHNSGKDHEIQAEPDQKSLSIKLGRKKYQVTLDEQTGRHEGPTPVGQLD